MTGCSEGRNTSPRRAAVSVSIRAMTTPASPIDAPAAAMASRAAAVPARKASMVASEPNCASSTRTAGRCRSCSIDGITLKSDIAGNCRITVAGLQKGREEVNALDPSCHPAILQSCNTMDHPRGLRSTEIPSAGTILAVCGAAGAADRGRARGDRSRSVRSALRCAAAALFDHVGVPAARRARLRSRARAGARLGRISRDGSRAPAAGIAPASGRATRSACATSSRLSVPPMPPRS